MLDWDDYGFTTPQYLFAGQGAPDDVAAAGFAVGYPSPSGVVAGLVLGSYRLGAGRVVLNTFRILETLDTSPYAGRLLLNLVEHAAATPAA